MRIYSRQTAGTRREKQHTPRLAIASRGHGITASDVYVTQYQAYAYHADRDYTLELTGEDVEKMLRDLASHPAGRTMMQRSLDRARRSNL
jgi:hypothetical protein